MPKHPVRGQSTRGFAVRSSAECGTLVADMLWKGLAYRALQSDFRIIISPVPAAGLSSRAIRSANLEDCTSPVRKTTERLERQTTQTTNDLSSKRTAPNKLEQF